jgi:hypothetical protein
MLTSIDDVIVALGGIPSAAERLGVLPTAIHNWKVRGKLPTAKFLVITAALKECGKKVSPSVFGFTEENA